VDDKDPPEGAVRGNPAMAVLPVDLLDLRCAALIVSVCVSFFVCDGFCKLTRDYSSILFVM